MIALIPTENPSADRLDCFIATATALTLAAVAASAGTSAYAAHKQGEAANTAANAQSQGNANALTFDKQKDAEDRAQFEATQKANYDQYLNKYNAGKTLGAEYGLSLPDAKPYVPVAYAGMPGQPTAPSGQPTTPGQPGAPPSAQDPAAFIAQYQKTHSPTEGPAPLMNAMKQAGFNVAPYMYGSTPSGNEISLNGSKYKVISGENGPTPGWYTAGTNDSAPSGSPTLANPIGSYLQGTMNQPQTQPFALRSINAFL